jgi:NH3-dependent NAD+ synthetase
MPIVHLYRTQAEALAETLGIPEPVRSKPADPDVMPSVDDKGALLGSFARADAILWGLENGVDSEELAAHFGQDAVKGIQSLVKLSSYMREIPYSV